MTGDFLRTSKITHNTLYVNRDDLYKNYFRILIKISGIKMGGNTCVN